MAFLVPWNGIAAGFLVPEQPGAMVQDNEYVVEVVCFAGYSAGLPVAANNRWFNTPTWYCTVL